MTLHKIDLTIYGDNPEKIYATLPDLMRIIKANKLNYEVGTLLKQVPE